MNGHLHIWASRCGSAAVNGIAPANMLEFGPLVCGLECSRGNAEIYEGCTGSAPKKPLELPPIALLLRPVLAALVFQATIKTRGVCASLGSC